MPMSAVLDWIVVILCLGGVVLALVGLFWHKTTLFLEFFDIEVKTDKGFWIMLLGMAMLGAGFGLRYLRG